MSTILNIHKLAGVLPADTIEKIDTAAALHKRHSNILFKIIDVNDSEIHVRAEQGKSLSENYADEKTLITRTRELFNQFTNRIVYTHPVKYNVPIVDVVTPEWIKSRMLEKGVKIKDMVTDTGISKNNWSNWINGTKPMSRIVRSLFYFYLTR